MRARIAMLALLAVVAAGAGAARAEHGDIKSKRMNCSTSSPISGWAADLPPPSSSARTSTARVATSQCRR
jgi:hypothetical protein